MAPIELHAHLWRDCGAIHFTAFFCFFLAIAANIAIAIDITIAIALHKVDCNHLCSVHLEGSALRLGESVRVLLCW